MQEINKIIYIYIGYVVVEAGTTVLNALCILQSSMYSYQWRSQDFSEGEAIVTTQLYGGPRAWPPGNVLKFGSLKRHLLHFEGTFEQNI